jgi:hypothetical protein
LTVVPHLLEAGDVVELAFPTDVQSKMIKSRRCKILSIREPDEKFYRASEVEWLDTGEREAWRWKAAKGVNQPVWVVGGPKFNAALRREAKVHKNAIGRWIWEGYMETVGV